MPAEYKASYSSGVYGSYMNDTNIDSEFDEDVINKLCALGVGSREQLIEASSLAEDYKDECSVIDALEKMQQQINLSD